MFFKRESGALMAIGPLVEVIYVNEQCACAKHNSPPPEQVALQLNHAAADCCRSAFVGNHMASRFIMASLSNL